MQSGHIYNGNCSPSGEIVLVVDDESSVLDTVCRMLSHAGFEVLAAASSEEALRIGVESRRPIDLMLCDVIMPGLSGPRMARQFAILHPETRLLFMAGLPDGPEIAGLLSRGHAFLPKPFHPRELVDRVREVLASGTGDSSARSRIPACVDSKLV